MLKLYNTLTKQIEEIKPIRSGQIGLYTCGPTVYDVAHIGNLRTYIFEDILKRALVYNGYKVEHAMNITDVGHLVGDGDEGEDKLEVGARREGKNPLDIAKVYTEKFFEDAAKLNIIKPGKILSATQSIPEQIEIIKILEEKGFAYKGETAVYFDTSKLSDYGKLSGQNLSEKMTGARENVVIDKDKKNPADFALWFFLKGRYEHHVLKWSSPWGEGFPGWHIECSAISRKLLGQPFDIHCGGVDHIGTHHANEIAQSEAAFGVQLCNVWMHGEFLLINAGRMGKSEGNAYNLDTIIQKGFSPLDYRYFCLGANYRSQLNFTWESLNASKTALERLRNKIFKILNSLNMSDSSTDGESDLRSYYGKFEDSINDDLNIPEALALVWLVVDNPRLKNESKINLVKKFDEVLGLDLLKSKDKEEPIPEKVEQLLAERQTARDMKDFQKSDELRKQIEDLGYTVKDTISGQQIKKL